MNSKNRVFFKSTYRISHIIFIIIIHVFGIKKKNLIKQRNKTKNMKKKLIGESRRKSRRQMLVIVTSGYKRGTDIAFLIPPIHVVKFP